MKHTLILFLSISFFLSCSKKSDPVITNTTFEEKQEIAQELDKQKRKTDPDYKGAFHEKKERLHEGVIDKRTGKPFVEKKPTKIRGFRRNKS